MVSKEQAVRRLASAGHQFAAKRLFHYRNKLGNNWGWDGWFRGAYPGLIHIVWEA